MIHDIAKSIAMGYAGLLKRPHRPLVRGTALVGLRLLELVRSADRVVRLVRVAGLPGLRLLTARPGPRGRSLAASRFTRINPPGFGDRQNSYAWSMAWFQGNLYVGTNRNFACVERATLAFYFPSRFPYVANPETCVTCIPNPYDLELRGDLAVFAVQRPMGPCLQGACRPAEPELPGPVRGPRHRLPRHGPLRRAGRDGGLYVFGTSAREYIPGLPPPRILRTTDGVTFTPIPQEPGTTLGDLDAVTFRASAVHGNRLFVTASPSLTGDGVLLESANPALGNDSFRQVTPSSLHIYELKVFNGSLYIGAGDQKTGYSVWKTDATGPTPYSLTPVVTGGAGRGATMASVVSMHVFDGRLYVGSAGWYPSLYLSCEVIRIEPDDSWEVVIGNPRPAPGGLRFPISGLPDGFGNPNNFHIWRMEDHQGVLYAGTFDAAARRRSFIGSNLPPAADDGFDLYASADGRHWTTVTNDAFGNPLDFGCRSLLSTPVGLFLGFDERCRRGGRLARHGHGIVAQIG